MSNDNLDLLAKIYELWGWEEFELSEADSHALLGLSERVYSLTKPNEYVFSTEEITLLNRLWTEYVEPIARKL